MKTLKICCALIGAATLLACSNLSAAIIGTGSLLITAPGFPPDESGPYTVAIQTVTTGPNLGTFETFCVGSQVFYNPGSIYNYQISTSVQPFATLGSGGLQYVALGTAWLYSQYRAGLIGAGSANNSVNDALQAAIWFLQGQTGGINNAFVTQAAVGVGGSGNLENNANGAYGVYALNLSPGGVDNFSQPQLCLIPVPEPGTVFAGAMLLLPLGASTIRILRKSQKNV